MKKTILWGLLVVCSWAMHVSRVVAAGDPEAGKKKFYTCEGCHGVAGYMNVYPSYHVPRLGGQQPGYVVTALKAYQAGQRKHGSMSGASATMSDQDMQDIAAFVSKFRGLNNDLPVTGNAAAGKEKAAACASCHGENGISRDPSFPTLAGQYESYLIKALQDYKAGVRSNPLMNGFAAALSEDDMKDLASYYASQKRGLTLPLD